MAQVVFRKRKLDLDALIQKYPDGPLDEAQCDSTDGPWLCTRARNHDAMHAAYDSTNQLCAIWENTNGSSE